MHTGENLVLKKRMTRIKYINTSRATSQGSCMHSISYSKLFVIENALKRWRKKNWREWNKCAHISSISYILMHWIRVTLFSVSGFVDHAFSTLLFTIYTLCLMHIRHSHTHTHTHTLQLSPSYFISRYFFLFKISFYVFFLSLYPQDNHYNVDDDVVVGWLWSTQQRDILSSVLSLMVIMWLKSTL